jgi:hypothetical protein
LPPTKASKCRPLHIEPKYVRGQERGGVRDGGRPYRRIVVEREKA